MGMNGREDIWSYKRGFVKASGLKERVCRSEALSVEMLKRFPGAMEARRQQRLRQQSFEALYQERLGKGLAGELRRNPFDNGVYCQGRGCTKATCETFGQDDGHAVQNTTHL
jgi:hypothetical protein